jgi:hypothetical protein
VLLSHWADLRDGRDPSAAPLTVELPTLADRPLWVAAFDQARAAKGLPPCPAEHVRFRRTSAAGAAREGRPGAGLQRAVLTRATRSGGVGAVRVSLLKGPPNSERLRWRPAPSQSRLGFLLGCAALDRLIAGEICDKLTGNWTGGRIFARGIRIRWCPERAGGRRRRLSCCNSVCSGVLKAR